MRALGAIVAALALSGTPVSADSVSGHADTVALTLYHDGDLKTADLIHPNPWQRNEGLAFIVETRTIDLPAGPSVIKLRGVASSIVPQTVKIEGLPDGVLEQNFDYDLLSPGSLLAKSEGKTVRLVRTTSKTGKESAQDAIVRTGQDGAVLEIGGRYEALQCGGPPERLEFDAVPEGLTDTPTLSIRTNAPTAKRATITLSYLATGLNWSADYVARLAPDGNSLDLAGWITLANFGTTDFGHVPVDIIAGALNREPGKDNPVAAWSRSFVPNCWEMNPDWSTAEAMPPPPSPPLAPPPPPPMAGLYSASPLTVVAQREIKAIQLGDYKLYKLPEPTVVSAQQTKQVQFLDRHGVQFDKVYRAAQSFAGDEYVSDNLPVDALLRLKNSEDLGLGQPLPAGTITAMDARGAGAPVLIGQDTINDTAVDLPMELTIGRAMGIAVTRRVAERWKLDKPHDGMPERSRTEVAVRNDKAVPVRLELSDDGSRDLRIVSESHPHAMDRGRMVWTFDLAPGARDTLTVEAEY